VGLRRFQLTDSALHFRQQPPLEFGVLMLDEQPKHVRGVLAGDRRLQPSVLFMDAIDLRTMSTIDRGDLGRRQRRSRSDFLIFVRDALQYRPQGDDLVTEMLFWPHRDVAVAGTGA